MPKASEDILKSLQPIADALKVAVTEIWGIYVRRYVAKGISQLLVAASIAGAAINKSEGNNWVFAPLAVALLIAYNAVNLLANPKYFAINDIVEKINTEKSE